MHRAFVVAAVAASCLLSGRASAAERPTVDFVLLADSSPALARSAERWVQLFSKLGVDGVQIRGAQPGEKIGIENRGTPDAASYHVIGELSGGTDLILPGGRFGLADGDRLSKWISELGRQAAAGVTENKAAIGLLPEQTAKARDGLSPAVDFATKGLPAAEVLSKIGEKLKYPVVVDPEIQRAIAADDPVRDELQGISSGTALAALVRPVGAVLQPREAASGGLEYVMSRAKAGTEAWPIGWPADQAEGKVVPMLLEAHNIEIRDIPLSQVVTAIQAVFKVPFLWDHNSILKARIDIQKKVSFPSHKAYYVTVVRQLLAQGNLRYSVRVDEAGKPLIWITTFKTQ